VNARIVFHQKECLVIILLTLHKILITMATHLHCMKGRIIMRLINKTDAFRKGLMSGIEVIAMTVLGGSFGAVIGGTAGMLGDVATDGNHHEFVPAGGKAGVLTGSVIGFARTVYSKMDDVVIEDTAERVSFATGLAVGILAPIALACHFTTADAAPKAPTATSDIPEIKQEISTSSRSIEQITTQSGLSLAA
jgi:hypothetical protein